jgi:hypothetical protein
MSRGDEMIKSILKECGYELDEERPRGNGSAGNSNGRDSDSPFRELNELALKNLDAWVPDAGIYKCQGQRGRYRSYTGVAQWRPSTTHGTDLDKRNRNLKICSSGIRDFGDNRGYTPIDLVMAAKSCDLRAAVNWLDEKLGWSSGGPEIDIEAIKAKQAEEERARAEPDSPAQAPSTNPDGHPRPPPGVRVWQLGDPLPMRPPFLVPNIIPAGPIVGFIGGQWGAGKSFVLDDLAVAIGAGTQFIGEPAKRGGVLLIELEASDSEARLTAAAAAHGVARERLPLVFVKDQPPPILLNATKTNPAFMKWAKPIVDYAKAVAAWHGVALEMIGLDCLVRVANFEDESNPSQCQRVMNALIELAQYAGCLVLVIDHHGKQNSSGLRGGSPKETNANVILGTGEKPKNAFDRRRLILRKMRNGRDGLGVSFYLEPREVEIAQIVGTEAIEQELVRTVCVRWDGRMTPQGPDDEDDNGVSEQERRALTVLRDLIVDRGQPLPAECEAPTGLRGVQLSGWQKKLISKRVVEGKNLMAQVTKLRNSLVDSRQIDIGGDWVWVPLGGL